MGNASVINTSGQVLSAPAKKSWGTRIWKHIRKYPTFWVGLLVLVFFGFVIVFADQIAPIDPLAQNITARLKGPTPAHIFGTDELGRDIFSRVVHGARISLPASFFVVMVSSVMGSMLGAIAGFVGGVIDEVIMRIADVTLAFPSIVLALAISAFLGPSLNNAILAACIVLWPEYARLMRSQVIVIRTNDYVVAARSLGMREPSILVEIEAAA